MTEQLPSQAYDYLRARIMAGELPPNSRIKEQEVASQLGISRTPVRTAIARLEMDGLVRSIPRKGAVVSPLELDEVDEIYEIWATLESMVARRACELATEAEIDQMRRALHQADICLDSGDIAGFSRNNLHFHAIFDRSSRSPNLLALLRTLGHRMVIFREAGVRYRGRAQSAREQHWGVLEALARRDAETAQRWMQAHADTARTVAIKTHLEERRNSRMPRWENAPGPESTASGLRRGPETLD